MGHDNFNSLYAGSHKFKFVLVKAAVSSPLFSDSQANRRFCRPVY